MFATLGGHCLGHFENTFRIRLRRIINTLDNYWNTLTHLEHVTIQIEHPRAAEHVKTMQIERPGATEPIKTVQIQHPRAAEHVKTSQIEQPRARST